MTESGTAVDKLLLDGEWKEVNKSMFGTDVEVSLIESSDIEFLVVKGETLHIWLDDTHYVGVGEVNSVQEGDVFYDDTWGENPMEYVYRIKEVENNRSGGTPVEVEFLYPSEKNEMGMDEHNVLYSSPTLLTTTGYALLDSSESRRVRES